MVSSVIIVSMTSRVVGEIPAILTYLDNGQACAIKSEHKFLILRNVLSCFKRKTGSAIIKKVCQGYAGKIVVFQKALWLPFRLEQWPLPVTILHHHWVETRVCRRTGDVGTSVDVRVNRGRDWGNICLLW